jgi:molecular chaperone DnaK (HSP70)
MEAGFGRRLYHTMEFGLTEPQAAAVHASRDNLKSFQIGDVMIVVDAGGGTTDFTVLEQVNSNGPTELRELVTTSGIRVGSADMYVNRPSFSINPSTLMQKRGDI